MSNDELMERIRELRSSRRVDDRPKKAKKKASSAKTPEQLINSLSPDALADLIKELEEMS